MTYIEISDLTWRYHENAPEVLKHINLKIEQGEFFGIMGATGAGKSSFALAVRGLIPAFFEEGILQGKVVLADINVSTSDANLLADRIGIVFQDASSQILGTTVSQDVAFGPSNLCYPKERILELVARYLDKVRLVEKSNRSPAKLSGGEMQRLAAAGVLCMEPSVLVLDEPAAELDPRGKDELCVMLDELRHEHNVTIILIEQDPELIVRYCDRIAIFKDGEIDLLGTPREVFSNTEKCIELGVFPPEIVQLAQNLNTIYNEKFSPLPLTANEMHEQILAKLAKRGSALSGSTKNYKVPEMVSSAKEELIRIVDLSHIYQSSTETVDALRNVNLEITAGEYVTIIGSNGAGKTTLTKHLNGLLQPSTGKVFYRGEDISKKQTAELSAQVGYCFQNPDHQIFSKTVLEEVGFGLANQGLEEDQIKTRVREALDLVGLGDVANVNPYNLGKGERQKVALASTFVLEPETLVIDEPTTGLDWIESRRILNLIHELNKKGTTVIVVTHDMRIVREYATRVLAMNAGEIVFNGSPYELIAQPDVFKVTNVGMTPVFHLYYSLAPYSSEGQRQDLHTLEDFSEFIAGVING